MESGVYFFLLQPQLKQHIYGIVLYLCVVCMEKPKHKQRHGCSPCCCRCQRKKQNVVRKKVNDWSIIAQYGFVLFYIEIELLFHPVFICAIYSLKWVKLDDEMHRIECRNEYKNTCTFVPNQLHNRNAGSSVTIRAIWCIKKTRIIFEQVNAPESHSMSTINPKPVDSQWPHTQWQKDEIVTKGRRGIATKLWNIDRLILILSLRFNSIQTYVGQLNT